MDIELSPEEQQIKVLNSEDLYQVMQRILLRENKIDRDREHFWVIGLAINNRILFIELISLGTVNATIAEPMEVFSFALQKRAVKIMLCHNHPSQELRPSAADKDVTDRMIQVGKIVKTPVIDHLIISETAYMSFDEVGLMHTLSKSLKYVPPFELRARIEAKSEEIKAQQAAFKKQQAALRKEFKQQQKEAEQQQKELQKELKKNQAVIDNKIIFAQLLIEKGESADRIKELTGLTKREITTLMKG